MIDILIWLAILPSAVLIFQVLKSDKVESEPFGLLARVFVLGAIGCIPAALLEGIGETIAMNIAWSQLSFSALMFLIVVPCAEEIVKYVAMQSVRKNPAFNYTFDGIVYGVMASLGFATLENLLYVLGIGDLTTAIMRGILSVPLHCTCGVFMGYYYGLAQWFRAHGRSNDATTNSLLSFVIPVIIHGLYDFSLDVDSAIVTIAGLLFTVVVLILAIRRVRASSSQDTPFGGVPIHPQQVPVQPVATQPVADDPRPYMSRDELSNKNYH